MTVCLDSSHRTEGCQPLPAKTRIYCAGRMTGLPDCGYPAFHSAARRWRSYGYEVINPAEEFGGRTDLPYETYMRRAIENVLKADAVIVLSGWYDSKGARLEVSIAEALGLPVLDAWMPLNEPVEAECGS